MIDNILSFKWLLTPALAIHPMKRKLSSSTFSPAAKVLRSRLQIWKLAVSLVGSRPMIVGECTRA